MRAGNREIHLGDDHVGLLLGGGDRLPHATLRDLEVDDLALANLARRSFPDAEEVAKMSSQLTALADFDGWRGLGRELRRLLNGETQIDWADLGPIGTAIMVPISIRIAEGS